MTKSEMFKDFISKNLPKAMKIATAESLGDRATYVGSSDIGGCLRKAYLDKTVGVEYDIPTLIRFQRGHLSEGVVKTMLNGLNVKEQAEYSTLFEGFELKAHIDFLLEDSKDFVVVEAKSVQSVLDAPYPSWVMQVQYQLHLLKQSVTKPVRAFVVALNINTGWYEVFDIDYNETLANLALANAKKLIEALNAKAEPMASEQLYCTTCPHKGTCPLLNKGSEQLEGDLAELAKRFVAADNAVKAQTKARDELKAEIEEAMRSLNLAKVRVDDSHISLTKDSEVVSFDTKALQSADKALYDELFAKYQKTTTRKGYLKII